MPTSNSDCWMKVDQRDTSSPHGAERRRKENRMPPASALNPASLRSAIAFALSYGYCGVFGPGWKSAEVDGIGPVPSLAKSPRKLSMKNGTLIACAMARRTRISESSLRRKLNSMVLVRALPSLPLVETMKRLSLRNRAMSEIVSAENGE